MFPWMPASLCIDPQPCFCKEPGCWGARHHCISVSQLSSGWGSGRLQRRKGQEGRYQVIYFFTKQWHKSSRTVDWGKLTPGCPEVTLWGRDELSLGWQGAQSLSYIPFPILSRFSPMFSERWLSSCLFVSPTNTENGGNWELELEGSWEFSKYPLFKKKINECEHRQSS